LQFSQGLISKTRAYFESREGRPFSDAETEALLVALSSYGRLLVKVRANAQTRALAQTPYQYIPEEDPPRSPDSTFPTQEHSDSCAKVADKWRLGGGTDLVPQYPKSAYMQDNSNNKAGRDA